jgi:hypothetical protein
MNLLSYSVFTTIIRESTSFPLQDLCNGFVVINKGTAVVQVGQVPLNPPPGPGLSGESWGVTGNVGEVYSKQIIEVNFDASDTAPMVVLIQKVYNRQTFS